MNLISTVLLALAMSTDAFAAAVVKGAELHRPHWREAVRAGLIFGSIEACTPVIGWWLGSLASGYIEAWDHWIAFALLCVLGAKMIHAGLQTGDDEAVAERPTRHSFWMLAVTGLATSIDAMAVGVGLAFLDVSIWPVAAAIGLGTFTMVTVATLLGKVLGVVAGRRAELVGGVVLIGIGATILYEHLHAAA